MNKILKLAVRNLTRQKRRNAILAIAIAFGFFVVTTIDGLTSGMVGNLEEMIIQMAGGTVLVGGFEKPPVANENEKSKYYTIIRDKDFVRNLVEQSDIRYEYLSCYTQSTGRFMFNGKKAISNVYGRDFSEPEFLNSFRFLQGGGELLNREDAVIISDSMADSLNVQVGDQLIYACTTIYGQNNVADFTVAGIIKSNSFINGMQTYVHIETLNKITAVPEGGYSYLSLYLKNKRDQHKAALKIEKMIIENGGICATHEEARKISPKNIDRGLDKQIIGDEYVWEGTKYGVETVDEAIPALKSVMGIVHTVTTIILIVILLIVMIGVSNTYRMVLYERIREIGTMRALGMNGKDTGRVFTFEATILCLLGAVFGLIFSLIAMAIIHAIPINNESLQFFLEKGRFSFVLSAGTIILQYVLLMILTAFAVRGSAKKASLLSPAEALRTVK